MVERRPDEATLSQAEMALMAAFEARTGEASPSTTSAPLTADHQAELDDYVALHERMDEVELPPLSPGIRGLILSAAAEQAQVQAAKPVGLLALLGALLRPEPLVAMATVAALAVAVSVRMDNKHLPSPVTAKPEMLAMGPDKAEFSDDKVALKDAPSPSPAAEAPEAASATPRPTHLIPGRYEPIDPQVARAARESAAAPTTRPSAKAAADSYASLGPEPTAPPSAPAPKRRSRRKYMAMEKKKSAPYKVGRTVTKAPKAAKEQAFAAPPPPKPQTNVAPDEVSGVLDGLLSNHRGASGGSKSAGVASSGARAPKKRMKAKYDYAGNRESANPKPSLAKRAAPQAAAERERQDDADNNLNVLKQRIAQIARAGNGEKNEARYVELLKTLRAQARKRGDKGIERWANKRLAEQRLKVARRAEAERKRVSSRQATKARAKSKAAPPSAAADKALSKD